MEGRINDYQIVTIRNIYCSKILIKISKKQINSYKGTKKEDVTFATSLYFTL